MNRIEDYSAARMREITAFACDNEELREILKTIRLVAEDRKSVAHFFYINPDDADYVIFKLRSLGYEVRATLEDEEENLYHYVVSW